MTMRVLILGGNGFVGRPIAQRLLAFGADVTVFHRGPERADDSPVGARILHGDRNQLDQSLVDFKRLRPDVVVDALAFTKAQAELLMNAFRGIANRVVVLSSGDVYRANDILFRRVEGPIESTPLTESSPLRERLYPYRGVPVPAAYGIDWDDYDKILVERAVQGDRSLPATVLRLPMVYGPGDDDGRKRRFMSYAKRMDDGRAAILMDRRTARWMAPWGYVEDIAEAVRLCVENERSAGEIYNVGESDRLDMEGWVREVAASVEWTGQVVIVDEPCPPPNLPRELNLDQHLDMNTTKIRENLGYKEIISRRRALETTLNWDRQHPPQHVDHNQFDYAAEDAILNGLLPPIRHAPL
jgi:nucleoside-diphosphate-sugar epimerase